MESDENKRAAAAKLLVNQLFTEIYGEDIEAIEEKDRNNEDFHFSAKNIEDHG